MSAKINKEDGDNSEKDLSTEFSDAIWDAANKFGGREQSGKSIVEAPTEESLWAIQNVLTFKDFCASPDHMNFPPLTDRQTMPSEYMFGDDPKRMFDTGRDLAVLVWGKGAGKDTLAVLMILYIVYVLLCTKNPQKLLGQADHADIDLLNVAASQEQADTVFFHKLKTAVQNWSWLKSRYDIQTSGRLYSSSNQKIETNTKVTITNDAIVFPHNIRAFSWSSEGETMEGKSLLVFVMDEADAFKTGSETRNADKIFRVCRTSANSRFGKKHKGFVISYPRSKAGFILKLYEKTKTMLSVYSDIAATWEIKPREMFSPDTFEFEGKQIPMDFYDDFRLDPIGSKRSYMCEAPLAETSFFEELDKIDHVARVTPNPLFEFKDIVKDGFVRKTISKMPYAPDRAIRYLALLDLGIKHDPTALTIMHRDVDRIVVDVVTRWMPDAKNKIIVDLTNVEDILKTINDSITLDGLYADHWNSALLIQKMRGLGLRADTMKIDYEDYEMFKRLVYAGSILLPKNAALLEEIKNLQLFSGKRVDHPEGGHNDMAATIVMGVKMLTRVGKGGSANMAAEGEYVGDNMNEYVDPFEDSANSMDSGIVIDGIPI